MEEYDDRTRIYADRLALLISNRHWDALHAACDDARKEFESRSGPAADVAFVLVALWAMGVELR